MSTVTAIGTGAAYAAVTRALARDRRRAARIISTPPAAWKLQYVTPWRPSTRAARPTVVGMSCSLMSAKTRRSRARSRLIASGPAAEYSSSPTLATPNHGDDLFGELFGGVEVGHVERDREPIACRESWSSSQSSRQVAHRVDAIRRAPRAQFVDDAQHGARVRRTSRCRRRPPVAPASIISAASLAVRDATRADDRNAGMRGRDFEDRA